MDAGFAGNFAGFDVGGSTIKTGSLSTNGGSRAGDILETPADPRKFLEMLADSSLLQDMTLLAFGIGIPGPVDLNGNIGECPALPQWSNFPLGNELRKHWRGVPFVIGNDANFATEAEHERRFGTSNEPKTMVMATIGTGVGGGIVFRGELLEGRTGEIGHLQVDTGLLLTLPEEESRNYFPFRSLNLRATCSCGRQGHIEAFVGKTALEHYFDAMGELPNGHPLRAATRNEWADRVFDLAQCGDDLVCKILFAQAFVLGMGFANLAAALDPDLFVIGGGYSKIKGQAYVDRYLFAVARGFELVAKPDYNPDGLFQFAQTGNSAGWMGAAYRAMELIGA